MIRTFGLGVREVLEHVLSMHKDLQFKSQLKYPEFVRVAFTNLKSISDQVQ